MIADTDDDNDGVLDANDGCASTIGWISTLQNDRDQDGCHDDGADLDDDGDGILDALDACLDGEVNWPGNLYNDWDQDGCNDFLEDSDDDNDGEDDSTDACPKGRSNWESERNQNTDFDMDGCYDSTEDLDDDNDSVNDVNATGATLDLCPTTPLGASDVDEFGCAAIARDTDTDGVNDLLDQCEGTPAGWLCNSAKACTMDIRNNRKWSYGYRTNIHCSNSGWYLYLPKQVDWHRCLPFYVQIHRYQWELKFGYVVNKSWDVYSKFT